MVFNGTSAQSRLLVPEFGWSVNVVYRLIQLVGWTREVYGIDGKDKVYDNGKMRGR